MPEPGADQMPSADDGDAALARLREDLARRVLALLGPAGATAGPGDAGAGAGTDLERLFRLLLRRFPDARVAVTVGPGAAAAPAPPEEILSSFRRTLDLLPDGVLLIGPERSVVYANRAFEQLWNIPAGLVQSGDEAGMLRHAMAQIEDPAAFRAEVERLYGSDERTQDVVAFKDGRIVSRRSVPFLQAEGDHGRIWIFTDVTEAWQARRDPLTGVANRRAYARRFPDFALRPDDGLLKSLAIVDVDNFKGYNDRYGHAAGDAVLIRVADVLSGLLSGEDDELFRIGGEEFVIVGKHRTAAGADALFERLRAAIERQGIEHAGNPGGVVTASFGVALFRGAMHPGDLFDRADQCLYRAKEAGRNRVTIERIRPHAAEAIAPAT